MAIIQVNLCYKAHPIKNGRTEFEQFYCVVKATNKFELGTRHQSSLQWWYLSSPYQTLLLLAHLHIM